MNSIEHDSDDFSSSTHSGKCDNTGTEVSTKKLRSSAKIGRKGDPRMHRAVGARIANPNLNLFEALRIGGFHYPDDDDPNVIDSEYVTLGQRKNQLCRRIRAESRQCSGEHLLSSKICCSEKDSVCNGPFVPIGTSSLREDQQKKRKKNRMVNSHVDVYVERLSEEIQRTIESSPSLMDSDQIDFQPFGDGQPQDLDLVSYESSAAPRMDHQTDESYQLAVQSLGQTAAAMGMTLDQLALSLGNRKDLASTLNLNPQPTQSRQNAAVSLFQRENLELLRKAMSYAGFPPQIVQNDESPIHLQVALSAWKQEGKRLQDIITRLRGKGAMPVLHQPAGCSPHLDFVVDNCVECYHEDGLKQYHTSEKRQNDPRKMEASLNVDPKIYDRNDLDFDNDEWNLDFASNDVLLSLLSSTDLHQNIARQPIGETNETEYIVAASSQDHQEAV